MDDEVLRLLRGLNTVLFIEKRPQFFIGLQRAADVAGKYAITNKGACGLLVRFVKVEQRTCDLLLALRTRILRSHSVFQAGGQTVADGLAFTMQPDTKCRSNRLGLLKQCISEPQPLHQWMW